MSFHKSSAYGSLPDRMGQDSQTVDLGSHKVIYCVHGKPSGCCATVVNDSSKPIMSADIPRETITIVDEDHCHRDNGQNQIDRRARRKLIIASILCLVFMIVECVGGYLSGSLAIATDAAHLLTDFAAFMISLFALWVSSRKPTQSMPFGWYRAEVIGALTSVLTIWVVTGILVYMAVERIIHRDFEIDTEIMLITSGFGVLVNLIMGLTLHQHGHTHGGGSSHGHSHGESENINVRAAFIHVVGDFLQSFGVFVAALVIYFYPDWSIVDPICTFLFSIIVLCTTMAILRDTLNVLMEGMPRGVDFNDVLNTFLSIDGVQRVHNLRIWALSLDKTALAAHLAISPGVNSHEILKAASRKIHSKFHFFEMTLQIEDFQEVMKDCTQCQCPEK
uniref:Zinc transporter 2 n=1 Tax=Homalodisca liturata TaxID=320908 RepID=A0A1B6H9H4_9HEMI